MWKIVFNGLLSIINHYQFIKNSIVIFYLHQICVFGGVRKGIVSSLTCSNYNTDEESNELVVAAAAIGQMMSIQWDKAAVLS